MKNKPIFFITGVSQTGGVGEGSPPLGNFSHIIPFFSRRMFLNQKILKTFDTNCYEENTKSMNKQV